MWSNVIGLLCMVQREVPRLYPRILTRLCPRTLSRLYRRPFQWFASTTTTTTTTMLKCVLLLTCTLSSPPHPTPPFGRMYAQVCLAPDLYVSIPTPPHPCRYKWVKFLDFVGTSESKTCRYKWVKSVGASEPPPWFSPRQRCVVTLTCPRKSRNIYLRAIGVGRSHTCC